MKHILVISASSINLILWRLRTGDSFIIKRYFPRRAIEFDNPGFTEGERSRLSEIKSVEELNFDEEDNQVIIYSEEVAETMDDLFELMGEIGGTPTNLSIRTATLDDVFLKLTGRVIEENE